jgi:motility quorum-sensing regulator/GCU-specific mRNA interferase toxin
MEKSTPHCRLTVVKGLVEEGRVRPTTSALQGAQAMNLDLEGMLGVVLSLSKTDFYKSMTTHADHRIWQDVYRPVTPTGPAM